MRLQKTVPVTLALRATFALPATFALVAILSVSALRAAEPFYEHRLEAGLLAYARDDYRTAARDLEIACFGLFTEPVKLAGCWAHLALAQAGADDRRGFAVTANRLLELERRLQAYSETELMQETRRAFEEQLRLWIPGEDLRTVPASSTADAEITPTIPEEPQAPEPQLSKEPATIVDEVEQQIEEARALLAESRDRESLQHAFAELLATANLRPEHRELQLVAAELGYRLRRWQDAVIYFQRAAVSESDRPERQFYYAVALLETGDREAAARVLELCLPRLEETEFVRGVTDRVFGREDE